MAAGSQNEQFQWEIVVRTILCAQNTTQKKTVHIHTEIPFHFCVVFVRLFGSYSPVYGRLGTPILQVIVGIVWCFFRVRNMCDGYHL